MVASKKTANKGADKLDSLKKKSSLEPKHGGKREGAGRPEGSQNKATLERRAVLEAFSQRVMSKADALFNAQLTLAVGSMKVFRIDEVDDGGGKKKRVHTHVTDAEEIKALLDEHEGGAGEVDGVYYYFADVLPDNKAIEAMLNRALGKAVEKHEHSFDLSELSDEELKALAAIRSKLTA